MSFKNRCVIELLKAKEVQLIDIHKHFVNVYAGETVNVSTVRRITKLFGRRQFDGTNSSASQFGGKLKNFDLTSLALKRLQKSFVM